MDFLIARILSPTVLRNVFASIGFSLRKPPVLINRLEAKLSLIIKPICLIIEYWKTEPRFEGWSIGRVKQRKPYDHTQETVYGCIDITQEEVDAADEAYMWWVSDLGRDPASLGIEQMARFLGQGRFDTRLKAFLVAYAMCQFAMEDAEIEERVENIISIRKEPNEKPYLLNHKTDSLDEFLDYKKEFNDNYVKTYAKTLSYRLDNSNMSEIVEAIEAFLLDESYTVFQRAVCLFMSVRNLYGHRLKQRAAKKAEEEDFVNLQTGSNFDC